MILQNVKQITQCAAELHVIQLFLYVPLNPHCHGTTTQCHHEDHLHQVSLILTLTGQVLQVKSSTEFFHNITQPACWTSL